MADTSVKYFDSTMLGAPTLSGTAGSMIGILDACLINGFGQVTLDSLVVAGGIATATRAAGHPMVKDGVAFIANASVGVLNGEQKVTNVTTTTFQFATTAADGAASGAITAKVAPAKWTKLFTGTNLAAYKSSDPASTGCVLRVDDASTQTTRVLGFETMSDINTGTGQFPASVQQINGNFWDKSSAANATANQWVLIADGRFFYFARAIRSGATPTTFNENQMSAFGDFLPTKSGDAYACIISGDSSSQAAASITSTANYWSAAAGPAPGLYSPRSYTTLGFSMPMGKAFPTINGLTPGTGVGSASGAAGNGTPFPNPTDGGVYVVQHYVFEAIAGSTANVHRGISPGFYCTPQAVPLNFYTTRDSLTGVAGLLGKTLKVIGCASGGGALGGFCFVDVTGPWR